MSLSVGRNQNLRILDVLFQKRYLNIEIKLVAETLFLYHLQSNFLEEYVSLSFYVAFSATMMNEIFLPCYFGNEVTLRREEISHAVYSSDWIHLSQKFKKNMIIFLEGLKRARILKSGKIFTLSLFSFLTVNSSSKLKKNVEWCEIYFRSLIVLTACLLLLETSSNKIVKISFFD